MENTIKSLIGKSLGNDEILKLIGNKANLISYVDVHKYKNLDQLLGTFGACVILYEMKRNYGHWCCIFKLDDNTIEFFDPYALMPDYELEFIDDEYKDKSKQNYPYLTRLMVLSPYILTYNHFPFQEYKKGINTCGRWISLRLMLRHLPLDEFIKLFDKKKKHSKDFYATLLTYFV